MITVLHFFPYTTFVTNYIKGFYNHKSLKNIFFVYGFYENGIHEIPEDLGQNEIISVNEFSSYSDFDVLFENINCCVLNYLPEKLEVLELLAFYINKYSTPFIIEPWGREVYQTSDIYTYRDRNLIHRITELQKMLIQKCNGIICFPKMENFLREKYDLKCKFYFFNALYGFNLNEYETIKFNKHDDNRLNIMIGHRGTVTGRHKDVLWELFRYRKDIDTIICPLSYGNAKYIKKIHRLGRFLFGKKWKPIIKWMPRNEYFEFLNENVDVAIFNNSESEAANNIWTLIYFGKMVMCAQENDSFGGMKKMGVHFFDWNRCHSINILKKLTEKQVLENRQIMKEFASIEAFQNKWEEVIKLSLKK